MRGVQKSGAPMLAAIGCMLFAAFPVAATGFPIAETLVPESAGLPGQPVEVLYRISWEGAPDAWRIPAPTAPAVDWGRTEITSSRTFFLGEKPTVEFVLQAMAEAPGSYELPELEFAVYAANTLEPNEPAPLKEAPKSWETADYLAGEAVPIRVRADYTPIARTIGLVCGLALLLGGVAFGVRRILPGGTTIAEPIRTDDPREYIHQARKHRLDGNLYAFYRDLSKALEGAHGAEATKLRASINERARTVGYGGERPGDDELDGALRDAERILAAMGH